MLNFSKLCEIYGLEIRIQYNDYTDNIEYFFYYPRYRMGYSKSISIDELYKLACAEHLEDYICDCVIEEMRLDRSLFTVELYREQKLEEDM